MSPRAIRPRLRWCARPAPSSLPRPMCPSSVPAPIRAIRSGAQPATPSTPRSTPGDRQADRQSLWRWTCCRCALARTPAVRCGSQQRSAASSAFDPRRALCPWKGASWAGRRSRCSVRWGATLPTPACCSPRNSALTAAIRCRVGSTPRRQRTAAWSTCPSCAWPGPPTLASARSAARSVALCAAACRQCDICSPRSMSSASTWARRTAASTWCGRRTLLPSTRIVTSGTATSSDPTSAPTTRSAGP